MNQLDLIAVGIVAISALLGLSRGFVREVLGLGAWVVAGWLSFMFAGRLIPSTAKIFGSDDLMASIAAYALVFIAAVIACSILANLIGRLVRLSLLGGLDRSLGMLFGAGRGAAVLIGAYILGGMAMPPEQWPQWVRDSRAVPFLHDGAVALTEYLPPRMRPNVAKPPEGRATTAEDLLRATPLGTARKIPTDKTKL